MDVRKRPAVRIFLAQKLAAVDGLGAGFDEHFDQSIRTLEREQDTGRGCRRRRVMTAAIMVFRLRCTAAEGEQHDDVSDHGSDRSTHARLLLSKRLTTGMKMAAPDCHRRR